MNAYEWLQTVFFFVVLLVSVKPFGAYTANVFEGERTFLSPLFLPCENLLYRICGVDRDEGMDWKRYAATMLLFNFVCGVTLLAMLLLQGYLLLNPERFPAFPWHLALNTAVSFTTNTNWQNYAGESTASYFTQMFGFAVHNFSSAATGIVIAIAVIRGLVRRKTSIIGNFWVDVTRAILYILLPLSVIFALFLVSQGVIQNFNPYGTVPLVQTASYDKPRLDDKGIPHRDVAGKPVSDTVVVKEARIPMAESAGNPLLAGLGVHGQNMEGKEVRFGLAGSSLFAVSTTATSCGAVNAMHDSLTPIGGMVPLKSSIRVSCGAIRSCSR